jgi:hypothetical protein
MKKNLFTLLVLLASSPWLFGNGTTPVIFAINDGSYSVPPAASFAVGHCPVVIGNGYWSVGVDVAGQGPGDSVSAYHDWGSTYSAGGVVPSAGSTNIVIDSCFGPASDANGSPTWQVYYRWVPGGVADYSTNVTLCLTNATAGQTCSFVWTYDGALLGQDDNVCATNSDCRTATIHYVNNAAQDTFSAYIANVKSSLTNLVVPLTNPSGSGQIQNFQWFVNGQLVKEIDHVCPGISQAVTVTVDLCNGSYNTQQVNAGPSSTNMNMTVSNPSASQTMDAYWIANGQLLLGMSLPPGGSHTYNQTFDLCGNPNLNLQWGGVLNDAGGSNPGNTPWDGLTNIFGGYTNASSGFGGTTRSGGGSGDTGAGTGSGSTGATGGTSGTGNTSNPNQPFLTNSLGGMVYTNNINWPAPAGGGTNGGGETGGSTAGLALDSTVRAGFGTLHNDNGQILQGLGIIDKDIEAQGKATNGPSITGVGTNVWVANQISTTNMEWLLGLINSNQVGLGSTFSNVLGGQNSTWTMMTNELGQQVALQWALSNDVMQVVKAITNAADYNGDTNQSYLPGIYTNSVLNNQQQQTYHGDFTNEMGQVISYEAVMSNELLVITKELTNQPAFTNPITLTVNTSSNLWVANWPTNQPYPTNLWVANMPTNFGMFTNPPFALTNYATESTLEGISNLLASLLTNGTSSNDIAGEQAKGVAAAVEGSDTYKGIFSGVDSTPAYAAGGTYGGDGGSWVIQIPYGAGYSIDLNPFHVAWVSDLARFVRNLVKWICIAGLLLVNIKDVLGAQNALGAARQATAAGETILGTNANSAIALLCAAAITLAVLALPAFAASWFTAYLGTFATNPFTGVGGTVGTSVWMVDQFFPIGVMVACVFCRAIFVAALSAVVWTVQTIVRFICG